MQIIISAKQWQCKEGVNGYLRGPVMRAGL